MPDSTAPLLSIPPRNVNAQAPDAGGASHTPPASVPALQSPEAAAKPWWQSKTIIGAVIVLLSQVLRVAGLEISADDPALTETVAALASIIGGVLAIYGRSVASRPVTSGVPAGKLDAQAGLLIWAAAFLGVLLLGGCTAFAQRVQGSVAIGYRGSTVRLGSDGKTTLVDVQLNPEGLAK